MEELERDRHLEICFVLLHYLHVFSSTTMIAESSKSEGDTMIAQCVTEMTTIDVQTGATSKLT